MFDKGNSRSMDIKQSRIKFTTKMKFRWSILCWKKHHKSKRAKPPKVVRMPTMSTHQHECTSWRRVTSTSFFQPFLTNEMGLCLRKVSRDTLRHFIGFLNGVSLPSFFQSLTQDLLLTGRFYVNCIRWDYSQDFWGRVLTLELKLNHELWLEKISYNLNFSFTCLVDVLKTGKVFSTLHVKYNEF